ncbi:MAG: phosphoribosylformylglycinamidine synthase subunit PurQ [Deinococcales bacterium]
MTIAVVRFPGSNCDDDARHAFEFVLGAPVRYVWHRDVSLGRVDAVVLPGGFSFGDYLRGGALAALSPVMEAVRSFAAAGGPVLGICNGWQILTEAGLLPGQLARNPSLHFLCQDVHLRVERDDLMFTRRFHKGQVLRLPIAHNEGRFYVDDGTLQQLEDEGRVVFRYVDEAGRQTPEANVNGSLHAIGGVVNERGNVLGMMPHPERAVEPLLGSVDGAELLRGMLEHLHERAPSA